MGFEVPPGIWLKRRLAGFSLAQRSPGATGRPAGARDFAAEALIFHPGVEDALFELPAIAQFEGGNSLFGDVLVERVRRDAKVLRSLPDIHHFACISHSQASVDSFAMLGSADAQLCEICRQRTLSGFSACFTGVFARFSMCPGAPQTFPIVRCGSGCDYALAIVVNDTCRGTASCCPCRPKHRNPSNVRARAAADSESDG